MKVLLFRPDPLNERFGLGPFFRVEPLGLGYIGQALRQAGHDPIIADLRFGRSISSWMRRTKPQIVGLSCMHSLEFDQVLEAAREIRRISPETFILVGGHAAAAYPEPFKDPAVDAVCFDDGEEVVPALVNALEQGAPLSSVPALFLRTEDGFVSTGPLRERTSLDRIPLPARDLLSSFQNKYHCLLFKPVWAIETARGCPFRCNFCSVWQLYDRSFRERSIGAVVEDFATSGPHIFVIDDLFWNHAERSLELARALKRKGIKKRWILVQSRCDLVANHPELLEEWRPLAEDFDIFFGLEAATDTGLDGLQKDAEIGMTLKGAEVARSYRYGVTGNFLVDPDWEKQDFEALWHFVAEHGFQRSGFTLLTPLPGTELFERMKPLLEEQPWYKYDMHHLLWEPRIGAEKFFELYAETWRRSILNTGGDKTLMDWIRQVRPSQMLYISRILIQTQRMMKASAYLQEHGTGATLRSNTLFPAVMTGRPPEASA